MSILQELEKIKKENDKLQEMLEVGVHEYEKTNSSCCDAPITVDGMHCSDCKEGCSNQLKV